MKERKLLINEREAPTVRRMFERFAALGSVTELCLELAQDGVRTKAWQTKDGRMRNDTVMDKQYLSKALRNPVYVGEIRHKNVVHAGQHDPIISRLLWDRVQAILAEDADQRAGTTRTRGKCDALLRGLLFGPDDEKYYPTFTKKASGKRYRYYYPQSDKKYGYGSSELGMLPADQIEDVVVNLVIQALQSPESMQAVWNQVNHDHPEIDEPTTVLATRRLGEVWKQLFPEEQVRLINLLIEHIDVLPDGIDIAWREMGWKELAGELAPDTIGSEMLEAERSQ
ncbi:recombinase family protein [Burkholderia cepacia]|uniref:recombinase family protein n=1 Tax=Burkholderia cepacia TaxID=292 RepID=UPI003A4E39AD